MFNFYQVNNDKSKYQFQVVAFMFPSCLCEKKIFFSLQYFIITGIMNISNSAAKTTYFIEFDKNTNNKLLVEPKYLLHKVVCVY